MLKVGDRIIYRPGFGRDAPVEVSIEQMERTEPGEKYGVETTTASWSEVQEGTIVFSLSNGHWAYGYQVDIEASKRLK